MIGKRQKIKKTLSTSHGVLSVKYARKKQRRGGRKAKNAGPTGSKMGRRDYVGPSLKIRNVACKAAVRPRTSDKEPGRVQQ